MSRSNLKRAKRLVAIFMLTVPCTLFAHEIDHVNLTDEFGNERVRSEIIIDDVRISLETSRHVKYSRENDRYEYTRGEAGRRARALNIEIETKKENVYMPVYFIISTAIILNNNPETGKDFESFPRRVPDASQEPNTKLNTGGVYRNEYTLPVDGISDFILKSDNSKEVNICIEWSRDRFRASLPPPYQNEWAHSFRLCNPLTITVVD